MADTALNLIDGNLLLILNEGCLLIQQPARHILIGRPLLTAIVLDTKIALESVSDRHSRSLNFT